MPQDESIDFVPNLMRYLGLRNYTLDYSFKDNMVIIRQKSNLAYNNVG